MILLAPPFRLFLLEQDPERYRDELCRADIGENVVESCFDEGVEAAQRKHRADSTVQAELVLGLDVVNVGFQPVVPCPADQIRTNSYAR